MGVLDILESSSDECAGFGTDRLTRHTASDILLKGAFPSTYPEGTTEGSLDALAALDDGVHEIL